VHHEPLGLRLHRQVRGGLARVVDRPGARGAGRVHGLGGDEHEGGGVAGPQLVAGIEGRGERVEGGVVRTLVPAVIASVFVLETVLGVTATRPRLASEIGRVTGQVVPTEAKQAARDFARSTSSLVSRL
jgi:hypothetical protein